MTAQPIAIVGMAGCFPGAASLTAFWDNILNRRDAAREVPPGRWPVAPEEIFDPAGGRPDHLYATRGCFLEPADTDPERLDFSGLDIDRDLLRELDPLYTLLLRAGIDAWRDARTGGLDRNRVGAVVANIALPTDGVSALARNVVGSVFEGRVRAGFFGAASAHVRAASPTGGDRTGMDGAWTVHPLNRYVTGLPVGMLCQALGLGGGGFTLDAACASSIYALHLGCEELRAGRLDAVLAGGISRPQCLYTQVGFSQLRALSPSGVCRPFDTRGDGLVVGEGAGIFVLKRLRDALEVGDRIYGVIRGIGLSNDVGGSLLAPASEGQLRAMRQAYAAAGWHPHQVDLIECHGTGTPRGDMVELESLRQLWHTPGDASIQPSPPPFSRRSTGRCVVGSVKSNIGHLLTAAGAAGLAKVLLSLHHATLPPSANTDPETLVDALRDGPFQLLEGPRPWPAPAPGEPRRAAVSAFGFGGINAHLLVEEWRGEIEEKRPSRPHTAGAMRASRPHIRPVSGYSYTTPCPHVAIVGMAAHVGRLVDLTSFREAVLGGVPVRDLPAPTRWHGMDDQLRALPGAWIDRLAIPVGRFRVPPGELPSLLPQQLLMLEVAADALENTCTFRPGPHLRSGVIVGMGLDLETTHFHLRWLLKAQVRRWTEEAGLRLTPEEEAAWVGALADSIGAPLEASTTLGALGGMIASRVARELRLGGPSFAVSAEEASGLRALETAVRFLQRGEVDLMVAGAVDLGGDVRSMLATDAIRPWSRSGESRPFDVQADGPLPGEGAAAVVLKRLDDALRDGDRIYATVKGIGAAHGAAGGLSRGGVPSVETCRRAMSHAIAEAGIEPVSMGLIEAHGSGSPVEDRVEAQALLELFPSTPEPVCALTSAAALVGHTGAAGGLVSAVCAALALFHEVLPPLPNFTTPVPDLPWSGSAFYVPREPQAWLRDRVGTHGLPGGPRRAGVNSLSRDGSCLHVVLEGIEHPPDAHRLERARPTGDRGFGLFLIQGPDAAGFEAAVDQLRALAGESRPIETLAAAWHRARAVPSTPGLTRAVVATDVEDLRRQLEGLKPAPAAVKGELAFVFPGSGNHYLGMGRALTLAFPEVARAQDCESNHLKSQLMPRWYAPWRIDYSPGWELEAAREIASSPHRMIFGQVAHGILVSDVVRGFGVRPDAVIGYSLGESAGLLATRAWSDRDAMFHRTLESPLFRTTLAGPCTALQDAWGIDHPDWHVAVLNRPADAVRGALTGTASLLIVNAPRECVIGGRRADVEATIRNLDCEALTLEGVPTVHCPIAAPAAEAYHSLHRLPTRPPPGVRFYSGAWASSYTPDETRAADSILANAVSGFDFRATIERAWADGVRVFLELGPQGSCTRMIRRILEGRPHLALSACRPGRDPVKSMLEAVGKLAEAGIEVGLESIYGPQGGISLVERAPSAGMCVTVLAGGPAMVPPEPPSPVSGMAGGTAMVPPEPPSRRVTVMAAPRTTEVATTPDVTPVVEAHTPPPLEPWPGILELGALTSGMLNATRETGAAHDTFLRLSAHQLEMQLQLLETQQRLAQAWMDGAVVVSPVAPVPGDGAPEPTLELPFAPARPVFDREMCMEFAIGSIGRMLGPMFEPVDRHPTRVRLPDEPLMLVDRIMEVEGEAGRPGPGRVVTEHDVRPGAWYLDGGRAPVCISVEAGQADLFLSAYLGIDLLTRGERVYRLLDAQVVFHRDLPVAGDTIRYDIHIEKFIRQGDTWLFFFHFDGWIGDEHLITMRDGCAGFFSQGQLESGRGIVQSLKDTPPHRRLDGQGHPTAPFTPLVLVGREAYGDEAVDALRIGDLERAFGSQFAGRLLHPALRLPGGRMRLVHRVLELDPAGGHYGLGTISGEADVSPDDWYLTCHFADDPVMPGTLMYECCLHTLRIFLLRMGWIAEEPGGSNQGASTLPGGAASAFAPGRKVWADDLHCAPVPGVASRLRCRGQVTPRSRKIVYRIDLKELGYDPAPYVLADAFMFADGKRIVLIEDMSLRIEGLTQDSIEALWRGGDRRPALYDRDRILAFAVGRPSEAFGELYRPFDEARRIARLPGPPFCFLDRITDAGPAPWKLEPGAWAEAQYDVPPDAWYFAANRQPDMPFAVVLEAALQPCGWLAAYVGSALRSREDLHFRNLEGEATLHVAPHPGIGTLTVRARLTDFSEAAGMLLQRFEFDMYARDQLVYAGHTRFGFFPARSLAQQVGIRGAEQRAWQPDRAGRNIELPDLAPHTPTDGRGGVDPEQGGLEMPGRAVRMVDRIDCYLEAGGPAGLGYITGTKQVDPEEWFFAAHFYQDPVIPGSLGLEAFLQLLKVAAIERWGQALRHTHRFEPIALGRPHRWTYRGQVIPTNREVRVEAVVTDIEEGPAPVITGDGFLRVDGRIIYEMNGFSLRLVPR